MQKLKKALKAISKFGKKTTQNSKAAKPAKKVSSVKKKSAPAPKKKAAPTKTAKKASPPAKKATTKAAAPTTAKKAAAKIAKPAAPAASKAKGDKAAAKVAKPAAAPVEKKAAKAQKAPKATKVEEVEILEPTAVEPVEAAAPVEEEDTEVYLTDADGRRYCRVRDCDQSSAVDGYCRFHYLLLWKKIQVRKKILTEGKLERYIEDLTARYPDKYLEMLKKDLRNEKDFLAAIQELEIDESAGENEFEEEAQNYLDEVRGMSGDSVGSGGDSDRDEY